MTEAILIFNVGMVAGAFVYYLGSKIVFAQAVKPPKPSGSRGHGEDIKWFPGVHVCTEFAASSMACPECGQRIDGIHDGILCGCWLGDWVSPCQHPLPEHLQETRMKGPRS